LTRFCESNARKSRDNKSQICAGPVISLKGRYAGKARREE
jgi:hypothetical protein